MPEDYMVISVRAPYTISEGSYKWYDVDFSTGKLIYDAAVAEKSRLLVLDFIDFLKKSINLTKKECISEDLAKERLCRLVLG